MIKIKKIRFVFSAKSCLSCCTKWQGRQGGGFFWIEFSSVPSPLLRPCGFPAHWRFTGNWTRRVVGGRVQNFSLSLTTETAVAGYQTFRRRCFVHFGGSFQVLSCVPPPVDGKSREVTKVELFWLNKRPFYAKVFGEREGPYISGFRGWRDGKVILFYPRPSIERIRPRVLYTKRVYFACWSPNHTMKGVERVSWKVDPS